MQLVKTTPELAYSILQVGNRKIKATKGEGEFFVKSIDLSDQTFVLKTRKGIEVKQNCEDYFFLIQVPNKAKSVY
jgi:hypothetical protein